jgi:hypothetical protein
MFSNFDIDIEKIFKYLNDVKNVQPLKIKRMLATLPFHPIRCGLNNQCCKNDNNPIPQTSAAAIIVYIAKAYLTSQTTTTAQHTRK